MRNQVVVVAIFWLLNSTLFSQEWSKFIYDDSGKYQGVKFSLKYPTNWHRSYGDHPNIVQNFGHEERRGYVKMVVYLAQFKETPSQSDLSELYSKHNLIKYNKVNKIVEFNNQGTIKGEKCVTATIQVEDTMYDQVVRTIVKTNTLIWKDYLFQVNFFIFSNDQLFKTMNEMYNDYNSAFIEIMGSLVVLSKWEK